MGGLGSGRSSYKTPIEALQRLDIRELKRLGKLIPDWRGTISWSCNGKPSGSIKYQCLENEYILNYQFKANYENEWKSVNQRIALDKTDCNFGGMRQWFVCPGCLKRVAVLCLGGQYFLCRNCYQLPYKSQLQTNTSRFQNQATKIKEKLGIQNSASLGRMVYDADRPRYMHHSTFYRLKNQANQYLSLAINQWKIKVDLYF